MAKTKQPLQIGYLKDFGEVTLIGVGGAALLGSYYVWKNADESENPTRNKNAAGALAAIGGVLAISGLLSWASRM